MHPILAGFSGLVIIIIIMCLSPLLTIYIYNLLNTWKPKNRVTQCIRGTLCTTFTIFVIFAFIAFITTSGLFYNNYFSMYYQPWSMKRLPYIFTFIGFSTLITVATMIAYLILYLLVYYVQSITPNSALDPTNKVDNWRCWIMLLTFTIFILSIGIAIAVGYVYLHMIIYTSYLSEIKTGHNDTNISDSN